MRSHLPSKTLLAPLLAGFLIVPSAEASLRISEFMADNGSTLTDEDGEFSDWIEISNSSTLPFSLDGYSLTDDAQALTKWTFPAVTLAPGGSLVVFASSKDRTDSGSELHTNFKLSSAGEYLALIEPGGLTVATEFAPVYPPQFRDESFGYGSVGGSTVIDLTPTWSSPANYTTVQLNGAKSATLNANPDSLDAAFSGSQLQYYLWFDFSSQLALLPADATIESATLTWGGKVGDTVFSSDAVVSDVGIFPVPDDNRGIDTVAAIYHNHLLPDYYAAHFPVPAFSAVPGQQPTATWDIKELVSGWQADPAAAHRGQLMMINSDSPMYFDWDLDPQGKPLLKASVTAVSDPGASAPLVYFDTPTPGAANSGGQPAGPIFGEVTDNPPRPAPGPLTVTARVNSTTSPVSTVTVFYRKKFAAEKSLEMLDDGVAPDAVAGDDIFTGTLPAAALEAGEMTRWRFVASDSSGAQAKIPPYRTPLDSHQYFGTVAHDPEVVSNLNVLEWFVQNPYAATTPTGTRGAVYYRGEFYDNVHFNRHGQSTGGFVKKSYNLDFNRTQRFLWHPEAPRVADIDLLTNWADKSKVRHPLAWQIMRESGVNAHFAFTVRVEQNGQFFSTADFVEDGDDIYLERAGLNKDGALYKAYDNRLNKDQGNTASSGFEKKNRKSENNADLQALIDGLDLNGSALDAYIRDNVDIPKTVNMLAANSVVRNIDMHSKNWYIYRDTGGTDEWAILPWDLDLSQGRVWNQANNYFDNRIYTEGLVVTGDSIRLVSHLFNNTQTRAMIMRRIRTLSDRFLQAPDTPLSERWYERRLDEQSALIDDPLMPISDAQRDFEKWGSWLQGSGNPVPYTRNHPDVESMAEAILRWKNEYLPGRRHEIYNRQTLGKGGQIPLPQFGAPPNEEIVLVGGGDSAFSFVPANGSLGSTWTGSAANEPFDTSAWIAGPMGIGFDRGTDYLPLIGTDVGSRMTANASIYLRVPFMVENPEEVVTLELGMQWDDGFVAYLNGDLLTAQNNPAQIAWNSSANGSHEADAGSYDRYNVSARRGSLKPGLNILAIQGLNQSVSSSDFVIRPELYAGIASPEPASEPVLAFGHIEFSPASGNQDEEFVEITNPYPIAVDVSDWQITGGIAHTFAPGTVIPAGGKLHLSPDVNAFRARADSPKGGERHFIQGAYRGHLSSLGETLFLRDPRGKILTSTSYTGNPSEAQRSLVISEMMYHPAGDGLAEYLELINISPTVTLDLNGVRFVNGVEFDFTGSAVTSLAPGGRVLVVADVAAFTAAYGAGHPIAGIFANGTRLSNGGETVKLEDALNGTVREFRYEKEAPWPQVAGSGYSLVLRNPHALPDPELPENWRASLYVGGNPGGSDAVPFPADPLGDRDGNGVDDLVDYALGNDLGLAALEVTISKTDSLSMTYPTSLGADQVVMGIESSLDLVTWTDSGDFIQEANQVDQGDGRALVTVRFNPTIEASGEHYFRLKVRTR